MPTVLEEADVNGGVTLAAGCYRVESVLDITDGVLRLDPGVVVVFAEDAGLDVRTGGRLTAAGTSVSPVTLRGGEAQRAYWQGIRFAGTTSSDNRLDYAVIEHGGSDTWDGGGDSRGCVFVDGNSVSVQVSNSIFRECGQSGFNVRTGSAEVSVAASTFESSDGSIWLHANLVGGLAGDLVFSNNQEAFVRVSPRGDSDVATSQTWLPQSVPYRLVNDIDIESDVTFAAGLTLEAEEDVGIDVTSMGTLGLAGTAAMPVTLVGAEMRRGYWQGIRYRDTQSSMNLIESAVIAHGGSVTWDGGGDSRGCVFIDGRTVNLTVRGSTFRQCGQFGLGVRRDEATVDVSGSTFEMNENPMWVRAENVGRLAMDLSFSGNDEAWVRITGGEVSSDQTWARLAIPYRVASTVEVQANLGLSPGTTLEFASDQGFRVDPTGTLSADATGADPIVFTAADGETLQGFWKGILFSGSLSAMNVLSNVVIEYGGSSGWDGGADSQANLFLRPSGGGRARVVLSQAVVRGSGRHGVSVRNESELVTCTGVTFENNAGSDLELDTESMSDCP